MACDELRRLHAVMLRIRRVEETLSSLFAAKEIPGFIHLSSGQEAVPAGLAAHLRHDDTVAITHRGHGHALAKGIPLAAFFAEMLGRDAGICRGRGGSMHIADASIGMLGANGIVAGGLSIATGSALAHQLDGRGAIAVACFGDGALAEGVVHECLNVAALWRLPCLFLCENNGWGEFTPTVRQWSGRLATLAQAFDLPYAQVDGVDALAVSAVAEQVIGTLRAGGRPSVLECHVARFQGHFEGDPQKYRADDEKAALPSRDPLRHAHERLLTSGVSAGELDALDAAVRAEIATALATARAAPAPEFARAAADVYAGATP